MHVYGAFAARLDGNEPPAHSRVSDHVDSDNTKEARINGLAGVCRHR
jgi:hypothetical protein